MCSLRAESASRAQTRCQQPGGQGPRARPPFTRRLLPASHFPPLRHPACYTSTVWCHARLADDPYVLPFLFCPMCGRFRVPLPGPAAAVPGHLRGGFPGAAEAVPGALPGKAQAGPASDGVLRVLRPRGLINGRDGLRGGHRDRGGGQRQQCVWGEWHGRGSDRDRRRRRRARAGSRVWVGNRGFGVGKGGEQLRSALWFILSVRPSLGLPCKASVSIGGSVELHGAVAGLPVRRPRGRVSGAVEGRGRKLEGGFQQ